MYDVTECDDLVAGQADVFECQRRVCPELGFVADDAATECVDIGNADRGTDAGGRALRQGSGEVVEARIAGSANDEIVRRPNAGSVFHDGLGSAVGVYLVGSSGRQTGSFSKTLVCGFVGGSIAVVTSRQFLFHVELVLLLIPLLAIAPIMATIGFNMTRRYKSQ